MNYKIKKEKNQLQILNKIYHTTKIFICSFVLNIRKKNDHK